MLAGCLARTRLTSAPGLLRSKAQSPVLARRLLSSSSFGALKTCSNPALPSVASRLLLGRALGGLRGPTAFGSAGRLFHSSRLNFNPDNKARDGAHRHISPTNTGFRSTVFYRVWYYSLIGVGLCASVFGVCLLAFFAYDASTYNVGPVEDVEVPLDAIDPPRGGPKNLPICKSYLDSGDHDDMSVLNEKPRLVILGTGWGSVSLLKDLDIDLYNVTVISPVNYFLFTPMLPSATVGTLELRSVAEPIRKVCHKLHAHFLESTAEDIDFDSKLVEVASRDSKGQLRRFYVPYDKLVIGIGCTSNTHGVEGLEYCNFLKSIQDARSLRNKIVGNLEKACLPTTSSEERKRLLSFVVCGGGPTGVELAAEISDMLNEDLARQYPKIIRNQVSVHILQSRSNILNTYDEKISKYAMERFKTDSIDVLTNSRVSKILPDKVVFNTKDEDGKVTHRELPFGVCIWSTGVAQAPLTKKIVKKLGEEYQRNVRAIETDDHLRVLGTPLGEVYAIGDCSTVRTDTAETTLKILKHHVLGKRKVSLVGANRISDEELAKMQITFDELNEVAKVLKRRHPSAQTHLNELHQLFDDFSHNKDTMTIQELTDLMNFVNKRITSLPATAQRASQQGKYLGKKFTRLGRYAGNLKVCDIIDEDIDDALYKPFNYHHLGSLAYVSNAAVFDLNGTTYFGGLIAMYLWRGVYFAQTVSFRTRALLFMDWLKRGLFGRDLADISLSDPENDEEQS